MPKRSSASAEILLGLLAMEPMSGYDLAQSIRASVGHFWNESYGQIYPNLRKLAKGGLVNSRSERQAGKPDRHVHSITERGRQRLREWLTVPPQPETPRNELLLKVFLGAQVEPEVLVAHVESMMRSERATLQKLNATAQEIAAAHGKQPAAPYWLMAVRFGQLELQAHLRWAEETLDSLRQIAAHRAASPQKRRRTHGDK